MNRNRKTRIDATENRQEIIITREFELPRDLLFRAFVEPEIIEEWMGTRVHKFENKNHGGYRFVTTDPMGNEHGFNGVIHEIVASEKITRTFEMEKSGFEPHLEFLNFEKLTDDTSRLTMHIIFRTAELRDQLLRLPFAAGVNMAHDRLQEVVSKLI